MVIFTGSHFKGSTIYSYTTIQALPLNKFEGDWKGKCVLDIKLSADGGHFYKPHTIDLGNCKSCSISTDYPIIM